VPGANFTAVDRLLVEFTITFEAHPRHWLVYVGEKLVNLSEHVIEQLKQCTNVCFCRHRLEVYGGERLREIGLLRLTSRGCYH
jgi:hypothetical protein